ncbi:MAG TPA: pyridoxal phosphate-dependent aminotransferase [Synergistaceae bacterium]|jgi:aspartate aminotransferase|uniref:pyridoxal phosphate-dependent aminotransferase n=1 Tax=Synergistaceae TaxID=649777 RepID=UPI000ECF9744|nr:pyridoxal phosphate-dependent aminotransferase [Synergistaceae bacterium DZ-S4]HAH68942.1 pyridoxal phosphate-dependent aminotransferase [Synergistaceae bacterium]
MKMSKRILEIQPSATLSISAKAKTMKAEGKPMISFSLGEPDFNSPECASKAAIEAIERGESHYTLNSGILELRKEVCNYYKRRFGLEYAPDEVLIAPGAKPLLYQALQMFVDPGDEVLLFSPAWVSYVEQIHLAGGKEVIVDTLKTDLIPTKEAVEAVLSNKTVGMIINSPSNPSGAIYNEETLKMIADIAREKDLWIIFDEIYERLVYASAKHVNILNVAPDLRDKVILINGASKAYAMTGWRIGYALGPKPLIAKMNTLQTHLTSNASSIAQWAAWGAVKDADPDVERMREAFEERRGVILGLVRDMPYVKVRDPEGAFYIFIDVRESPIPDDMKFCEKLLEEKFVAAVPGAAFYAPGFVRFSYACSMDNIREGMGRLKEFLQSL